MGILDDHLAKRDWIVGEDMTIADLSCAGYMFYADEVPVDWEREFPNLDLHGGNSYRTVRAMGTCADRTIGSRESSPRPKPRAAKSRLGQDEPNNTRREPDSFHRTGGRPPGGWWGETADGAAGDEKAPGRDCRGPDSLTNFTQ